MRLRTKPTWPQLRPHVEAALAGAFTAVVFAVAADDGPPEVAWRDGPSEGSVAGALGDLTGWTVESAALGPDPAGGNGRTAAILLRRTLSHRALAVTVVRFRACSTRPYAGDRPEARQRLWAITEEDDPARRDYPLVDAMADMLLDVHDGDVTADALSATLERVGYDALWNRAWSTTAL